MLLPVASAQFKRDTRRAEKRGKDMAKLGALIRLLAENGKLPERHRDHPLKGEWLGWRDAHIEPDWVLIYRVEAEKLWLGRTGTHADLFNE